MSNELSSIRRILKQVQPQRTPIEYSTGGIARIPGVSDVKPANPDGLQVFILSQGSEFESNAKVEVSNSVPQFSHSGDIVGEIIPSAQEPGIGNAAFTC